MNPQIKGQTKEATDKEAIQVKEEVQSSFQPPPPLSPDSANIADPAMADVSQVGDAPPEPPRGGVVMQSAQWSAISGSRAVHNWSAIVVSDDDDWGTDSDDSVQWIRSPPAMSATSSSGMEATLQTVGPEAEEDLQSNQSMIEWIVDMELLGAVYTGVHLWHMRWELMITSYRASRHSQLITIR